MPSCAIVPNVSEIVFAAEFKQGKKVSSSLSVMFWSNNDVLLHFIFTFYISFQIRSRNLVEVHTREQREMQPQCHALDQ